MFCSHGKRKFRRRLGVLQPRQAEAAVQGVQADRSRGSSRTGRRGAAAGPDSPTGAVASAGRRATVSDWQQGDGIRPRQPAVAGTSIPQAARRAQARRYRRRVGDSADTRSARLAPHRAGFRPLLTLPHLNTFDFSKLSPFATPQTALHGEVLFSLQVACTTHLLEARSPSPAQQGRPRAPHPAWAGRTGGPSGRSAGELSRAASEPC